jgi:tRNA threonylcarbamoyladenosine biosynthesis protein TsaE
MAREIRTTSSQETFCLGSSFASTLHGNEVIGFFGPLGSGKTTFLKGMISTLIGCDSDEITSPTFSYLHIYYGKTTVYHFDLYRIASCDEFFNAGFAEYFNFPGVCCLEWAERIEQRLPMDAIKIILWHEELDVRHIVIP